MRKYEIIEVVRILGKAIKEDRENDNPENGSSVEDHFIRRLLETYDCKPINRYDLTRIMQEEIK